MPYIKKEDRFNFRPLLNELGEVTIKTPGELNYLVSMLCQKYIKDNGLRYQKINDVVGALDGAKMEFYRRVAVPYEDEKIKESGDIGNNGYMDL
jgi:hypothetical protein